MGDLGLGSILDVTTGDHERFVRVPPDLAVAQPNGELDVTRRADVVVCGVEVEPSCTRQRHIRR